MNAQAPLSACRRLLASAGAVSLLASGGVAVAADPAFRGLVELENNRYPVFASNPQQSTQDMALKLQLEASYKPTENLAFQMRTFLRRDGKNDDRDTVRFDEVWMQYATPQWDLRFGNQLVTWGSVESVSPLDIVNPRDYEEDIVEPIKIGIPVGRFRWRLPEGDFSMYWLPYFKPSRFAGPQSFYSISGGIPNQYPESERAGGQWAARYFHTGDGFDYGISYFRGIERNTIFGYDPVSNSLVGRTYRSQRLGLETTKVLGEVLLKGEFVYRTSDETGNRRALLYAIGSEYTVSSVWEHSDLTLFAEYLASSHNVSTIELMQNDIFVAARWTINDHRKQRLQAGIFWDLDHREAHVYRVEYTTSPAENIDAGIRYTQTRDYFPGPHHTTRKDGVLHLFLRHNF